MRNNKGLIATYHYLCVDNANEGDNMKYLNQKSIKQKLHDGGRQITIDGLQALDHYIDKKLETLIKTHNGGHNRLTAEIINLILTK